MFENTHSELELIGGPCDGLIIVQNEPILSLQMPRQKYRAVYKAKAESANRLYFAGIRPNPKGNASQ